ncbi:Pseudouridylate synthase 3 [Pleurostoma richardsiae]|uniref:Pseudouridylate synthase 3 n=1 Tax=Pleurostoma richardsiae TaxID=41990 RepID=A0AA38RJD9_9PEZI|nr:Pseudouridylate synthase 3 [Pleurostoma richardsiae]
MDKPPKYNQWTKEALVKRVELLEEELKNAGGERPLSPTKGAGKKKRKSIDPSRYSTRYIALKFAYLGKNYNGFEYQASGEMPTIEEELWKALVKSCLIFPERPDEVDWTCCEYSKCGRTDRGVSAFGQVVGLRVRSNKPLRRKRIETAVEGGEGEGNAATEKASEQEAEEVEEDNAPYPVADELAYCRVLNSVLPPDIRCYAWCPTPPPDFSARFSCRERQYRYFFTQPALPPVPSALEDNSNAPVAGRLKDGFLDIDAMRKAAKLFEGLHDFRNFCKIDPSKQITNFLRRVYEADISEVSDVDTALPYLSRPEFLGDTMPPGRYPKVYSFDVRGSAFLWHQIRHMVAIIFLVGQGLEPPSIVTELLDVAKNPRKPNYVLAEDTPLVLWDCLFGRELGEGGGDELDWVYVGADEPLSLYGTKGSLADQLWKTWSERKMDEILANRLLDWVTTRTDVARAAAEGGASKRSASQRLFEGGGAARYAGTYVPVLKRPLLQSPEEVNDKWAQRKGFANAEEMRAKGNGNWRDAVRAAGADGKDGEMDENVE